MDQAWTASGPGHWEDPGPVPTGLRVATALIGLRLALDLVDLLRPRVSLVADLGPGILASQASVVSALVWVVWAGVIVLLSVQVLRRRNWARITLIVLLALALLVSLFRTVAIVVIYSYDPALPVLALGTGVALPAILLLCLGAARTRSAR